MAKKSKARIHSEENPGHTTKYEGKQDAYFCVDCDVWLEVQCTDPGCAYCVGRPEKPNQD